MINLCLRIEKNSLLPKLNKKQGSAKEVQISVEVEGNWKFVLYSWQVRTHFARPNWKEEFTRISAKHPGSTVGNVPIQFVGIFRHLKIPSVEHGSIVLLSFWSLKLFMHAGVFYCGKPTLAKELKKLSLEMSHKTTTRFHFHKEYF